MHKTFIVCDISTFDVIKDDEFQKFEDMMKRPLKPFTRSHAKDLKKAQSLFMKKEMLKLVMRPFNRFYVLKVQFRAQNEKVIHCLGQMRRKTHHNHANQQPLDLLTEAQGRSTLPHGDG